MDRSRGAVEGVEVMEMTWFAFFCLFVGTFGSIAVVFLELDAMRKRLYRAECNFRDFIDESLDTNLEIRRKVNQLIALEEKQ